MTHFRHDAQALVVSALLIAGVASAQAAGSVAGSWSVTYYLDPGHKLGGSQCIVFAKTGGIVGEALSGTWTSTTFTGWDGNWVQRGDAVEWSGFTSDGLATFEAGHQLASDVLAGTDFVHNYGPQGSVTTSSAGTWTGVRTHACPSVHTGRSHPNDPAR
jgi:hypothetical protein